MPRDENGRFVKAGKAGKAQKAGPVKAVIRFVRSIVELHREKGAARLEHRFRLALCTPLHLARAVWGDDYRDHVLKLLNRAMDEVEETCDVCIDEDDDEADGAA